MLEDGKTAEEQWRLYRRIVLGEVAEGSVQVVESRLVWYAAYHTCLETVRHIADQNTEQEGAKRVEDLFEECQKALQGFLDFDLARAGNGKAGEV